MERLWGEDTIEAERRLAAIEIIKKSIDNGVAAVAWDISGCEWGAIIGYDDDAQSLLTLKIDGCEDSIPYEKLGQLELPILSVLTITGKTDKSEEQLVSDTKKLAASHLHGEEWCENAKGLAAYDALIEFIDRKLTDETAWNLEYYLGTYGALKWYAWKFFEKYGEQELAKLYKTVHECWQNAYDCKRSNDVTEADTRTQIIEFLKSAKDAENKAVQLIAD